MKFFAASACAALFGMAVSGAALAEETGKDEYMNNCASCHGETGAGDGPLADLMTVKVPPLTGLTAANDGVFPMLDVIHTIDGRQGIRGHGYPMPVWGDRFTGQVDNAGPYGSEVIVRGRVLSLAYYLESIQD
ncbi:c-type cytochrome [Roseovarius sp. SYSU LYC5161]|uniref:c-type cytochrome n=1 Tax=Roseovarius halophilus (ex Wu et al. 2025) TaxID=3376060 RepID=UPI003999A4CF